MPENEGPSIEEVEAAAMRFLGRRDYGREELARKLRKRDFPDQLIEEVLNSYEEAGYLDDARFAAVQGAILARKCWGPRQISYKLRSRGIDEATVERALDEIGEDESWTERARERLQSRFGDPRQLDEKELGRAYRHLTYRGYSPPLVRRLLFDD